MPKFAARGAWTVCFWLLSAAVPVSAQNTAPPVLSVPFHTLREMSSLMPYGMTLLGSGVLNPTYQVGFRSYRGTYPYSKYPLKAVCDGVVTGVWSQPGSGDYEIFTKPTADSIYDVLYDHVKRPKVRKGDWFRAGAVLGYFGNELQINRTDPVTRKVISVCPRDLGTAAFNRSFDDLLAIGGFKYSSVCLLRTVIP